jgi:hypothetical protein
MKKLYCIEDKNKSMKLDFFPVQPNDVELYLKDLLTFGNSKLPKTTAIFNMGPATKCPSKALGLCELCKKCYALKAEKMYPTVLPYRIRQSNYWYLVTAEQFAAEFIAIYKRKRIKPIYLRFNESGDFWTQACYNKAFEAAAIIQKETGVISYCYTHRTDLNYYNSFTYGLKVIQSGNAKNTNISLKFIAVKPAKFDQLKQEEKNASYYRSNDRGFLPQDRRYFCPADCKKCNLCATAPAGTIYCKLH